MLPFPQRACQPFLMGKPLRKQLSPATRPKSGAPTLKRFCPQGQTASTPHTGSASLPAGQGSVISSACPVIPSAQERKREYNRVPIAYSSAGKNGRTAYNRKEQAAEQRFQRWRGGSLLRRSKGRRAARRPSGPEALARSRRAQAPRVGGLGALFRSECGGRGADGGRLGSRSLPPAKAGVGRRCLAPQGQGGTAGVRGRRCLPLRGKSASELARLILGYRGGKLFAGRFALQE